MVDPKLESLSFLLEAAMTYEQAYLFPFALDSFARTLRIKSKDIAELVGVSTRTVQLWRAGKFRPPLATSTSVLRILNDHVTDLPAWPGNACIYCFARGEKQYDNKRGEYEGPWDPCDVCRRTGYIK